MEVRQILWEERCFLMTVRLLKDIALAKMKHYRAHALSEKTYGDTERVALKQ